MKVLIKTTGEYTEYPVDLTLIRRRFLYSVNFDVDHKCPVNDVSLKYSDHGVETTYTFADDMTLTASPGGPHGPPVRSAVTMTACDSRCTATATGAPGTPEMQGMAGTFLKMSQGMPEGEAQPSARTETLAMTLPPIALAALVIMLGVRSCTVIDFRGNSQQILYVL